MAIDKVALTEKIHDELDLEIGIPCILFFPNDEKNTTLTGCKLGGVPYWDKNRPYPTDKDGNKLMLLAQFNLGEIAEVWPTGMGMLPQKGILQFFLLSGDDYLFGMNFDNYADGNRHRVIYHPSVDPNVTEQDVLALDIPTSLNLKNDYEPIRGELAYDFKACVMAHPDYGNYREAFMEKARAYGWKISRKHADKSYDVYDWLGDEAGEKLSELTYFDFTYLLGYPFFLQNSVYEVEPQYAGYDMQLLQIASINDGKNTAMWGDTGIAHFLINHEKLEQGDFSDVMYYWDCY